MNRRTKQLIVLAASGALIVYAITPIKVKDQVENCATWAFRQFRRDGGYIAFRRSIHFKWIPHLLWHPDPDMSTWKSFSPRRPKKGWRVILDCLRFRGVVEVGDDGRRID